MITLSQAAKSTGKSKSVISRAIQQGKLAAKKDTTGIYQIDKTDLLALWPEQKEERPKPTNQNRQNVAKEPEPSSSVLQTQINLLQEQLERVRENEAKLLHIVATNQKDAQLTHENGEERLAELRAERDAWREQADDWKTQASNQTLLLNEERNRRRWFGIFG